MVLDARVLLCVTDPDFFLKKFLSQNWENGPKIRFFGFIGKFSNQCFLNLVYKESSYYLLYSYTNSILGKNLVPEMWGKILSANQIAGFLDGVYIQNKMMKKPDFLHVDKDSWKLKGNWKILEWVWPLWSKDTNIGCISRRN